MTHGPGWAALSSSARALAALAPPSGLDPVAIGTQSLLGWQVNHGFDHEGEFFPVAQFRDRYHHPEVIDSILDTLDEGEALRQAGITPRVFGAG